MEALVAVGYLVGAYLIGSLPFAYLVARVSSGSDLRRLGSGTVSGTGVGRSSGFWPMAVAGIMDIAKGAAAVLPTAGERPLLAAGCAGAVAAGHNWSIFLRGEGGRAISASLGSTLVLAWPGTVVLSLGMGVGRLCRHTGLGSFISQAILPGVLAATHGEAGAALGGALVLPMWLKRLLGNGRPRREAPRVYLSRLLFDNDEGLRRREPPPSG